MQSAYSFSTLCFLRQLKHNPVMSHCSEHVLQQLITLRLASENDVAAFVLELEQDFCQIVVELRRGNKERGQK